MANTPKLRNTYNAPSSGFNNSSLQQAIPLTHNPHRSYWCVCWNIEDPSASTQLCQLPSASRTDISGPSALWLSSCPSSSPFGSHLICEITWTPSCQLPLARTNQTFSLIRKSMHSTLLPQKGQKDPPPRKDKGKKAKQEKASQLVQPNLAQPTLPIWRKKEESSEHT